MPEFIANLRTSCVKPLIRHPMANRCNQSSHMTYPHQHLKFEPPKKSQLSIESVDSPVHVEHPNRIHQLMTVPFAAKVLRAGILVRHLLHRRHGGFIQEPMRRRCWKRRRRRRGKGGTRLGRIGATFLPAPMFHEVCGQKRKYSEKMWEVYIYFCICIVNCWKVWDNSG